MPFSGCLRHRVQGHFEYFICDTQDLDDPDGVVDQECLNKHPLNRAYNKNDASTIDPNYPGRYYLDPPCRRDEVEQNVSNKFGAEGSQSVKMRYTLPDIECEHCVLQMHWCEFGMPTDCLQRTHLIPYSARSNHLPVTDWSVCL